MRQEWGPEELVEAWTLIEGDWDLVANKRGPTRLGFAVLLKFFELEARFPQGPEEVPAPAIAYLAEQLGVPCEAFGTYAWGGRAMEYHRAQIREAFGFREATRGDEAKLTAWLGQDVAPTEISDEALVEALAARCRVERIEPPGRVERIVAGARAAATAAFCERTMGRLSFEVAERLEALARTDAAPGTGGPDLLSEIKADPAQLGLETFLAEVDKLERVRALQVPVDLFEGTSDKVVDAWRARAAAEYPSDLATHPPEVRLTLLACLCHRRVTEITDSLVDLLVGLVHKIDTRAERRVEGELLADLRRVRGKQAILFRMAEAALAHPDHTVRDALYPVVPEATLVELVKEADANENAFRARVRTVLRSSYSTHYRRMLPRLLGALEFRSNNLAHRPIIAALGLLARYCHRPGAARFYDPGEVVPLASVVPAEWGEAVVDAGRVERVPYELCVLRALRGAIRRREVWVVGADRWRDPEADLPSDFEDNRERHYAALRQPLDPTAFVADLRRRMEEALEHFDQAIGRDETGGVSIGARRGEPWIGVPKLEAQPEPSGLDRVKSEIIGRWGNLDLLAMLGEADHLVGLSGEFPSIATRQALPADVFRRRLLLVLFALGTNTGIARVAAASGEAEAALRHVRRHFVNRDNLRRAIVRLVNATFTVRDPDLWGEGTACASDSKKFGAWDANLMTEWHNRYRGPGVMIYWHVERKSVCIYSQLKSCSSSEVAAMMEGVLRHCTSAEVDRNYVDTHGQSSVGFAFAHLLGFQLLPRLKNIASQRLYRPDDTDPGRWGHLGPALTRPIRWDVIAQQYDQMVKYATALRLGTAEAESILRRFTRPGPQHPTYAGLLELGRAERTVFLARYLRDPALRQEVHSGLQVVENWNSGNGYIFYGKDSELPGADRDSQEVAMLALHLLQLVVVHINTLLVQRVLTDNHWAQGLGDADRRGITPLFWSNWNPYGRFELDLDRHLDLAPAA
jgi:TnpA family transposase